MTKPKQDELAQQVAELTMDAQRTRADFENYRKRVEGERTAAQQLGETKMVMKLLPILDTLERAISHAPAELADNTWVQGVIGIQKQLSKLMEELHLVKIVATPGTPFDPLYHQAVQMEEAEGEHEVVAEELQAGYLLDGNVVRHAMVKVTRQ